MPHIPPEIIDIIIGFVPSATFYLDHRDKVDDISVLLDLSLVSRDWVFPSRRELFQRQHIVFNVQDSLRISDFVEILQGRDQLPNIPHILSFLSTITFITPAPCIERIDHKKEQTLSTFLCELTKRKDFFQPVTLRIKWNQWDTSNYNCLCSASSLIPAIAEAFSTITHLDFNDLIEPDCSSASLIASFKELRELDVWYWAPPSPSLAIGSPSNEFLQTYRIPETLHTLQYTSAHQPSSNHWYEINAEHKVEWLQSHPPLPQMRRLSFVDANPCSVIQALIDICPDLNALFLSHWCEGFYEPDAVIDLSRHKQLARLCVHIPRTVPSYRIDFEEYIWNKVLRTVRTATSLRCSLEILFHASHACEESTGWWHLLGEAVSALPKDVVLKVRIISAHSSGGKKGEDFIRKVFRDLSNHRRILFGRQEKLAYYDEPRGWRNFDVTDESTWKTITVKDE